MKRLLISMAALIISATTISAQRLTDVRVEAQYITDKMALELGLSSAQRNSIFSLNLAYLNGITSRKDINAGIWRTRNARIKAALTAKQWRSYVDASYFYRPIGWRDGAYVHNVYARYPKPGCGKDFGPGRGPGKRPDMKPSRRPKGRPDMGPGRGPDRDPGMPPGKHKGKGKGPKDNHREPPRHGRR